MRGFKNQCCHLSALGTQLESEKFAGFASFVLEETPGGDAQGLQISLASTSKPS